MEDNEIKQAMSEFYASIYDGAMQHIREYVDIRDKTAGTDAAPAGGIEELKAVVQLTLAVTASMFEESEHERFFQIESSEDWTHPLVRYIVEYREDVCENPDYRLDPIQGWVEDLSERGFLKISANEGLPPYSLINWTIENRSHGDSQ